VTSSDQGTRSNEDEVRAGNSLPGSSQRQNVRQAASDNVRMAQVVVIGWPSSDVISDRSPLERSWGVNKHSVAIEDHEIHGEPATGRAVTINCRQDIPARIS
jgi:hypothetical protein